MEINQRCKIKNQCIFGTYLGPIKGTDKAWFYDEEISKVIKVKRTSLEEVREWL